MAWLSTAPQLRMFPWLERNKSHKFRITVSIDRAYPNTAEQKTLQNKALKHARKDNDADAEDLQVPFWDDDGRTAWHHWYAECTTT